MYVKEIWRYPVKSTAGERIDSTDVTELGLTGDRQVLVLGANGRVVTSRTQPRLLGLKSTLDADGEVYIDGHHWKSDAARALVERTVEPGAHLTFYAGPERFDILPLLVATDGAIDYMKLDGRRLRPNLIIGGVEGLAEREWPGRRLRIGDVVLHTAQLRGRCVMTTFHPDTLQQDRDVLRRIARELDGTMGLDTAVEAHGRIREGDPVSFL